MATTPVSSIIPLAPPSNALSPAAPPLATQPDQTSDAPPQSSPSLPATSSASPPKSPPRPDLSPPQSPPPPDLSPPLPPAISSPPPSLPLASPPTAAAPPPTAAPPPPVSPPPSPLSLPPPSPPASPPPLPPATPTPAATSSPPPPILSPPLPSEASSPPPIVSPPPPSEDLSPPQPSPVAASPPPPSETPSPPLPVDSPPPPPKKSPTTPTITPPSPPVPVSPTTSPSPPIAISSPPPSVTSSSSPTPIPPTPQTNSTAIRSSSPTISPLPSLPSEKPTAGSTTPGASGTVIARPPKGGGGMMPGSAAAVGVVVGFLALILMMAVWFARRQKRRNGCGYGGDYVMPSPFASSQNSDSLFMRPQYSAHLAGSSSRSNFTCSPDPNSKSWFTYEELFNATQGFSAHKLLGEGGFGCVYKGLLIDGREVAVKQLKIGGGQGEREFRAEVEIIGRVHHRHLVSLVGYCISDHQRLLVYEYVPNNTLHYHLHGEGRPVMEWSTRVKVAAGAARGIAYLHEDCNPRIIHRDIKSSNILLDNNFEAQVADFGLAKLAADVTHVTTRVMGTFGYLAPEYASSGKLTEKSDVFSYGVVLLELITGRKPVDASQPLGDESLVEWARPLLNEALENERFEDLIDQRLGHNYVEIEMFRMIEAAAACIRHLAPKRPRMSQVVRAFDSMAEYSDLNNGMKVGQSEIYDSREQSAQIRIFQRMAFGSQDYSSEYCDRSHSSWKTEKLGI